MARGKKSETRTDDVGVAMKQRKVYAPLKKDEASGSYYRAGGIKDVPDSSPPSEELDTHDRYMKERKSKMKTGGKFACGGKVAGTKMKRRLDRK